MAMVALVAVLLVGTAEDALPHVTVLGKGYSGARGPSCCGRSAREPPHIQSPHWGGRRARAPPHPRVRPYCIGSNCTSRFPRAQPARKADREVPSIAMRRTTATTHTKCKASGDAHVKEIDFGPLCVAACMTSAARCKCCDPHHPVEQDAWKATVATSAHKPSDMRNAVDDEKSKTAFEEPARASVCNCKVDGQQRRGGCAWSAPARQTWNTLCMALWPCIRICWARTIQNSKRVRADTTNRLRQMAVGKCERGQKPARKIAAGWTGYTYENQPLCRKFPPATYCPPPQRAESGFAQVPFPPSRFSFPKCIGIGVLAKSLHGWCAMHRTTMSKLGGQSLDGCAWHGECASEGKSCKPHALLGMQRRRAVRCSGTMAARIGATAYLPSDALH